MKFIPQHVIPDCCPQGREDVIGEIFVSFGGPNKNNPSPPYPMRWFAGAYYDKLNRLQVTYCPWCAYRFPENLGKVVALEDVLIAPSSRKASHD